MRGLEARVPPVVVFLIGMGIIHLGARLAPGWGGMPTLATKIVTAVLLIAGGIFGSAGVAQFLQAKTTIHPNHPDRASALVTGGVYRITRNPMYLGLALLLAAYGLHRMHPATLLALAFFVLFITRFQIMPEERALIARFPETFTAYARRVRRWL